MDLNLPGINGIEATGARLRESTPAVAVLIVTMFR